MQTIVLRQWGQADILKVEEAPGPAPQSLGADEVLLDVHYSGINFADIIMRLGFYQDAPPRPFTPGYEVSGIIQAVGRDVTNVKVGDEVFAGTFFGGYASQVKLPSWQVIPRPSHLTLKESAGLTVAFLTANSALFGMGRVRAGDKVMIDCATGGVGTMALELLKGMGVEVLGLTSSAGKKDFIRSFGARAMTHEEFYADPKEKDYDMILNSQGGSTLKKHLSKLAPTGRVVCLGVAEGITGKRNPIALLKTVFAMWNLSVLKLFDMNSGLFGLNALKLMENTEWIKARMGDFKLIEEKKIRPVIGATFKASEAAQAHKMIETRQARGKVLLSWKE